MISEKRVGDAHDRYDRNGKKETPEESLTKARSQDILARPEKSEMNGPITLEDKLIIGGLMIGGLGALIYFFFFKN